MPNFACLPEYTFLEFQINETRTIDGVPPKVLLVDFINSEEPIVQCWIHYFFALVTTPIQSIYVILTSKPACASLTIDLFLYLYFKSD